MATWKEKGVVPDSDDEDFLDSQSSASLGDLGHERRYNEFFEPHKVFTEGKDGENRQRDEHQRTPVGRETSIAKDTDIRDHAALPLSSPIARRVFKDPRALWNSDSTTPKWIERQESIMEGPQDDISQSYVRLMSPMSSTLSSLSGSQGSQDVHLEISGLVDNSSRVDNVDPMTEKTDIKTSEESINFNRRSLRQRNPIQLHPYIVEQEKYRRSLQARGLKPMRLAQSQDRHTHSSTDGVFPDAESLGRYSQEMDIETEDSQQMNVDWNSSPPFQPSPDAKTLFGDGESNAAQSKSKEEDGFPDIDELMKGRDSLSRQPESKGQQKNYSTKYRHRQLSVLQPRTIRHKHGRDHSSKDFDVPASPPTTSSPFPNINKVDRTYSSRTASVSSKATSSTWLDDTEITFAGLPDLPTPVTSATKPISDPIIINSDSDIDDPFASQLSTSPSASSSDESIQIRKVGKRIRGVLPASHLRLDQNLNKPIVPSRAQRESLNISPAKEPMRRGIALPRLPRTRPGSPSSSTIGPHLLFDKSEEEDEDVFNGSGVGMAEEEDIELEGPLAQQRMGYAEEGGVIDTMLPSRKYQDRDSETRPRKRRRVGSLYFHTSGVQARQPKITQHLVKARKLTSPKKHRTQRPAYQAHERSLGRAFKPQRSALPRISILDVMSCADWGLKEPPQFIRVAARTARSRKDQGRQSPTRKFIRLANHEDTSDAQSVLREWKDGKIQQHNLRTSLAAEPSRPPLRRISGNVQTKLEPPVPRTRSPFPEFQPGNLGLPRKLVVSKGRQRTMSDFVASIPLTFEQALPKSDGPPGLNITRNRQNRPRYVLPKSRPAQLESTELEYTHQYPTAAFRSTKKALDSLYRTVRKHPTRQANLQLSRFLADEDVVQPSIENESHVAPDNSDAVSEAADFMKRARNKKRPPHRLDVGAAMYRQPSEPLILDLLAPSRNDTSTQNNKLIGLGKFGTRYPIHFDIFPLRSGIFFHESTFIGAGLLSAAINHTDLGTPNSIRSSTSFLIGEKLFQWGVWDENVSSEVGLCFDWIAEQINLRSPSAEASPSPSTIEIMESVIGYVQTSLSLQTSEACLDFLARMLEVINDLLTRIRIDDEEIGLVQSQLRIEILARCAVLAFQLLQKCQRHDECLSVNSKFEDLLVDVSRSCITTLLFRGVEDIRKLYDDLQYLSYRDKGIRDSQYTVHAWVILIRVLDAAKIPTKSFWDVTNAQLLHKDIAALNDARKMEKIWYIMFTLLPLSEFDECGVVIEEARRTASFDNWWLPQQMLKRVFALYSLNTRQSPSFNEYCRAVVSRCHFLMVEWGWWNCNGIIGTIFDFFASQNLAHLRNEEVHRSPQFLEHLANKPSLAVEPEDRCFHIFLKIIALEITHMSHTKSGKGIRNLVTRLLPNHDRQYPKEDDILERELAALRNHHDLLCTLYWAAPPGQRPPLALIQDLVEADRSHNAACLINLKAWNHLSRFVLASSDSSASFKPLASWLNAFFTKLWEQFLQEDTNSRRQAELHSEFTGKAISETRLRQQIAANKSSTLVAVRMVLRNLSDSLAQAQNDTDLLTAFDTIILASLLASDQVSTCILDISRILMRYMDRINDLRPYLEPPPASQVRTGEDDSQSSFDLNTSIERQILIFPLCDKILSGLFSLTRKTLESHLYPNEAVPWLRSLIECWARLVSFASEETLRLQEFLPGGSKAVFAHRNGDQRANTYWPLFLAELLKYTTLNDFYIDGVFDIDLEWLLVLTVPPSEPFYEKNLSKQLDQRGFYMIRHETLTSLSTLRAHVYTPLRLLKDAIDIIREVHQESKKGIFHRLAALVLRRKSKGHNANSTTVKSYYSQMLKDVMDSMQHQLESMARDSTTHMKYVVFCQEVVSHIRSRASNLQPLTDFFTAPSSTYWPEESDPNLYAAGIISYSLRLEDNDPGRVSAELFHYLWRGWRNSFIQGQLGNHIDYITKGLKYFGFFEYMLTNFVPAVLEVGFSSDLGWVIPWTYLPPVAHRLGYFLRKESPLAPAAFALTVNLLKIIANYILAQSIKPQQDIKGIHPMHRGIVAIAIEFCISVQPSLQSYAEGNSDQTQEFYIVAEALRNFARRAILRFEDHDIELFEAGPWEITQGPYVKNFVTMIMDDIDKFWHMDLSGIDQAMTQGNGSIRIRCLAPIEHKHMLVELEAFWGPPLLEVLSVGFVEEAPPPYADRPEEDEQLPPPYQDMAQAESNGVNGEVLF